MQMSVLCRRNGHALSVPIFDGVVEQVRGNAAEQVFVATDQGFVGQSD
jgi:hypothetical protein